MKTTLKRLSLAVLIILVVLQIPFIYRRIQFGEAAKKIDELKRAATTPDRPNDNYTEYRGVFHVHTSLGGHSTGSLEDLLAGAHASGLDFVITTEHWTDAFDTAELTLKGQYGRTLFIAGNEIDSATPNDRLLTVPGRLDDGTRQHQTPALIQKVRSENRLAFVTYPEKFTSWNADFDGIEVFSLHTNALAANRLIAFMDVLWSYPSYPELVLMDYFSRPVGNLQKFDEIASRRKVSLIAGADAHSNIGFHVFGDDAGNKMLSFKLDDYSTIFRLVRQHVLIPSDRAVDQHTLLTSIKNGHSFIGLDGVADTTGFYFASGDGDVVQGQEVDLETVKPVGLTARSPLRGHFVIYRNGEVHSRFDATDHVSFTPAEVGAYRVEVFLDELGPPFDTMPWIISNPIFVRSGL